MFPNPISIAVDAANSQIVVANSNVDILYDTGSIAVLSVDATDTSAPQLSATQLVSVPNFAVQMFYDGANSLFVPFREESDSSTGVDIFKKYTVSAGNISEAAGGTVLANPYGITSDGASLYVVSDDVLGIYDTDLNLTTSIDLTTAESAGIDDSDAGDVLSVAVNAASTLAAVSNLAGRLFIVDLASDQLAQAVEGPTSTRDVIIDGSLLYALDGVTEAVWVFNLDDLSAASSAPESVDDSKFVLTTVDVGTDPLGMVLDAANSRLYVANSGDDTISVIDTLALTEVARISLDEEDISSNFLRDGDEPVSLSLGTFNGVQYLFVACFKSHAVAMIHTGTLNVVEVFPNTE